MKAASNARLKNVALIGRGQRRASFFLAVLLITGTARAGQLQPQGAAAELQRRGDLIGAERKLQDELTEARAAGSRSVEFAQALAVLCVFYQDIGRFSQAESSFNGSLKILRGITGHQDPAVVPLIIHLAWLYLETGRAGPASRLHPQSWVERLTLFDPESKYLPSLLEISGGLNTLQGTFATARDIYRKDFDLSAKRGADLSVEMASALNNFGFIQLRAGLHSEALNDFSKALQLWTRLSGPDDLQVAISRLGLAETYMSLGRSDESSKLLQRALPIFEQRCGPNSLRTEDVLTQYAQVLRHQKRKHEAKKLEERARLIRRASDFSFEPVIDVSDLEKSGIPSENSSNSGARQRSVFTPERRVFFVSN